MDTLAPLVGRFVDERRRRGDIRDSTAEDHRSRLSTLSRSFGPLPLEQLDEPAIEAWLASIGWMQPGARRSYLSTIKVFSRWMVRRGYIATDPTIELDPIREPRRVARPLPEPKVERLLDSRPGLRDQAVLLLMVGDGLRCAEVAVLRVDDFDPIAATLFVRGKGSHERLLPVPSHVAAALHRHLDDVGWLPGPLVRPPGGGKSHMSGHTVSQQVTRWLFTVTLIESALARPEPDPRRTASALLSDVAALVAGTWRRTSDDERAAVLLAAPILYERLHLLVALSEVAGLDLAVP